MTVDASHEAVGAVPAAGIRARRRPGAVAFVFMCQLLWGLVVAAPAHAWARRVWGAHPAGDGVLWLPGARELLVWLGDEGPARGIVVQTTLVLLLAGAVLAQVPLAALLTSLVLGRGAEHRSLRVADALRRGAGAFIPLGTLFVLFGLVQVGTVLAFGAAGWSVAHTVEASHGDARAATARFAVIAVGVVLALAVGAIGDVVRAAAVRAHVLGAPSSAIRIVLTALRRLVTLPSRAIRSALLAWAMRGVLGLALVALGAMAADALGGRGGFALVALWTAHQAVVLGRTALRASWLARASATIAAEEGSAGSEALAKAAEPAPATTASDQRTIDL